MNQYLEILMNCEVFDGLERESVLKLMKMTRARVAEYHKGETIYQYGERVTEMGIVLEGTVVVEADNAEGEKTNLNIFGRGTEIGAFLVISSMQRSPMWVYAGMRCRVMFLDILRLREAPDHTRDSWMLMNNLLRSISERCVDLYQRVQIFGQKRVRSRVRMYLMSLPEKDGEIELSLNRTALAAYLGVDRTALARELGRMEDEGIIGIRRRRIKLINRDFFQMSERAFE